MRRIRGNFSADRRSIKPPRRCSSSDWQPVQDVAAYPSSAAALRSCRVAVSKAVSFAVLRRVEVTRRIEGRNLCRRIPRGQRQSRAQGMLSKLMTAAVSPL